MKKLTELLFLISLIIIPTITVHAQRAKKSIPVFQDGEERGEGQEREEGRSEEEKT